MKKLLSVFTIALLICSFLAPQVFAIQTGPSIPTGLAGITHAGYLMEGEIGNAQVKYETTLPLGEIKDNIKPAPNPAGKKTTAPVVEEAVEEEVEEEVVVEEVEEEEAAEEAETVVEEAAIVTDFVVVINEEPSTVINSKTLLSEFDAEASNLVPILEGWVLAEENITGSLMAGEFAFIYIEKDLLGGVIYNSVGDEIVLEIPAGAYYTIYTLSEGIAEAEDFVLESVFLDAFAIINNFYIDLTNSERFLFVAMLSYANGVVADTYEVIEYVAEVPAE